MNIYFFNLFEEGQNFLCTVIIQRAVKPEGNQLVTTFSHVNFENSTTKVKFLSPVLVCYFAFDDIFDEFFWWIFLIFPIFSEDFFYP